MKRQPTAVDLFCGCGGFTCGLKNSKFKVVSAIDCDPLAVATYRSNHPEVFLLDNDIREISPAEIAAQFEDGEKLDLLVVCAPCQPFSSLNRYRGRDDRVPLILEAVRFAAELEPAMIFFENVPGLNTPKFRTLLTELRERLEEIGYFLGKPKSVNVSDYGVPQRRLRCIMLATKDTDPPELPLATTPEGERVTVRDAIANLPRLSAGEYSSDDPLHFARNHTPLVLKRLSRIPKDGGSRSSLPIELQLDCHKCSDAHPDVYGRMAWLDVAPTLTTGCTDLTKGRFAHPEDDRSISLREAARLQTFPDNYKFCGSHSAISRQIGNAVPVRFVEEIIGPMMTGQYPSSGTSVQ